MEFYARRPLLRRQCLTTRRGRTARRSHPSRHRSPRREQPRITQQPQNLMRRSRQERLRISLSGCRSTLVRCPDQAGAAFSAHPTASAATKVWALTLRFSFLWTARWFCYKSPGSVAGQQTMPRSAKYEFREDPAAKVIVQSAGRLIKLILQNGADILPEHRRMVLDAALWKITGGRKPSQTQDQVLFARGVLFCGTATVDTTTYSKRQR